MKFLLAVVAVIGAMSFAVVSADSVNKVERFWTILVPNPVMFMLNQSEANQHITFKRRIDSYNTLLLDAVIKNTKTDEEVFNTGDDHPVDICATDNQKDSWATVVHLIFTRTMLPGDNMWDVCPIDPQDFVVNRYKNTIEWTDVPDLPEGKYEINYTVKTRDGRVVFSPLKYTFSVAFKLYLDKW